MLEDIAQSTQEEYRAKALTLFGVPVAEGENPKRLMQKAYLAYSTISSVKPEDGTFVRAKWQDQISHEHKIHGEIMTKLGAGERVEGIEKDPLESKEADMSYDYNMVPGFLRREKSTAGDEKYHLQPHEKSIKAVNKMLEKAKNKKKEKLSQQDSAVGEGSVVENEVIKEQENEEESKEESPYAENDGGSQILKSEIVEVEMANSGSEVIVERVEAE